MQERDFEKFSQPAGLGVGGNELAFGFSGESVVVVTLPHLKKRGGEGGRRPRQPFPSLIKMGGGSLKGRTQCSQVIPEIRFSSFPSPHPLKKIQCGATFDHAVAKHIYLERLRVGQEWVFEWG